MWGNRTAATAVLLAPVAVAVASHVHIGYAADFWFPQALYENVNRCYVSKVNLQHPCPICANQFVCLRFHQMPSLERHSL